MAKYLDDAALRTAIGGRMKVKNYAFPGAPDSLVGIKLLTDSELDGCRVRAQEHVRKHKIEMLIDPEFFDRALHRETIAAAFRDPSDAEQFYFPRADVVAELDSMTVRALYELYITHHHSLDPYAFASEEEVIALSEALGKSETGAEHLSLFDAVSLRSLLLSMASTVRAMRQQFKSPTG